MADLLLSKEKRNHFERKAERAINSEFDVDVSVQVGSHGTLVLKDDGRGYASIVWDSPDEVASVLQDVDFTYERSSYDLLYLEDAIQGQLFHIIRDGWGH